MALETRQRGEMPKNLRQAVTKQCRICNDVAKEWHEGNDCTDYSCWIYPYRPGTGGSDRAIRKKSEARAAASRIKAASLVGVARKTAKDKR